MKKSNETLATMLKGVKPKNLDILIRRFYTDVNGVIIDKATLPVNLQTELPVFVFNEYDRAGGYFVANKIVPPPPSLFFLQNYVWGSGSFPYVFGFSGVQNIQTEIKTGDLVTIYTDNLLSPNYFCFIIVRSDEKPLASILSDLATSREKKKCVSFNMLSNNIDQYNESFVFYRSFQFGEYKSDIISPNVARNPLYFQRRLIDLNIKFDFEYKVGFVFPILFNTDRIEFNFSLI